MKIPFFKRAAAPAAAPAATSDKPRRHLFARSLGQMFKAAQSSKNDDWSGTPTTPDSFIQLHHSRLVARSREQWSNNDYVRGFVRIVRRNIVGPKGVRLQAKAETPRGKLDTELNRAIEAAWCAWGEPGVCEVTGDLSWRGVQSLVVETTARDGEYVVRIVTGKDAGPMGFALQLIDPQRLSVTYENSKVNERGDFIRHSIEYNRYGRPIAYHFASTDEWDAHYYSYAGRGFVRIPAEEIIHGFVKEQVGLRRGLPWASTSLFRLHHLQGFEDAAVQNARASAAKMGFIQYENGFGPEADEDTDVAATIEAEPLSFHELPEGASLANWDPNYPSGEFATFHKAMLRGAATGMGVDYNTLGNDLEGVNFSSIRQGTLETREHWMECQEWLIDSLCKRVYTAWLRYQLLAGGIVMKGGKPVPAVKLAECLKVLWQPRRWAWIDPRADVEASVTQMRAGLTTPSEIIRESGRDPETVFQQFAQDLEAMKAAGITDEHIQLFLTGQPPKPEPKPADKEPPTTK